MGDFEHGYLPIVVKAQVNLGQRDGPANFEVSSHNPSLRLQGHEVLVALEDC